MPSLSNILPIAWVLLLSLITIQLTQPISVRPADHDGFSAVNAMKHLNIMASEIHPMGTVENRKVKDYILEEFAKLNIPTELFIGHAKHEWGEGYMRIGRTENIIATIKGKTNGKAVMVVGHYDSVWSSPGAADDVHSVACILEIAKILQQEEHDNDIIFLITDGEEAGLFGAKAYTEQEDVSHIGVLLNYEARGNSGPSMSFEWSEGNSWLVHQLRKVATRPIANSMSFEIYKNLPNDTDFTFFKKAGINGINHAFIDGFSYYHNPADTPENINQNSVQHTGTNMLALTKHFANVDLSQTQTHNATFFNFFNFMIVYPSSWDIVILILTCVGVLFLLYSSFKKGLIQIKSFGLSFLMILISIVLSALISYGLSKALFALYPQYEIFYAGQFYNHKWYLLFCVGISLIVTGLCVTRPVLRANPMSYKAAMLLFLALVCLTFYVFIPTATYFMLYPLIAMAVYYYMTVRRGIDNDRPVIRYATSIIPLTIWLPSIILFFLAFSLVGLPMPTVLLTIIALSLMVFFDQLWTQDLRFVNYIGGALLAGSLLMGHLSSTPTEREPLPSSLFYHYDVTTSNAKWASEDKHINIGNHDILAGATRSEMPMPYTRTWWNVDTDVSPHVAIPQIVADSSDTELVRIISTDEVYNTRLLIHHPNNVKALYLNDQELYTDRETDQSIIIEAFAMIADTLSLRIIKKDESIGQKIGINSNFLSMPGTDSLPDNSLRTDGYTCIVQEFEM